MTGSDDRRAIFRDSDGRETELVPGETLRMGRHADNDIVIHDTTVSRFHATIRWDPELERPVLYDNGSANGTLVNEREVNNTAIALGHASKLQISEFTVTVELENCGETPAILKGAGDMVTLFSEQGPEIKGTLGADTSLRDIMQRLEVERRSGTLKLTSSGATITVCLGKMMAANVAALSGHAALEKILDSAGGGYRFTLELEPTDQGINLFFSDYNRQRKLKGSATRAHKRRALLAANEDEDEPKTKR